MIFGLIICASLGAYGSAQDSLVTDFSWKFVDYLWESDRARYDSMLNGSYVYKSNVPIDVDRSADGRTFLALAGGSGVPATLCTVSNVQGDSGPLLAPYPDWLSHQNGTCDSIVSASGITIDSCNRLWVLDSGKINGKFVCDPKLLAFDLNTNELAVSQIIPLNATNKSGKGLFYYPVVLNNGDNCRNTTVFVADAEGNALVVWDGEEVTRMESKLYEPDLNSTEFSIDGEKFNLTLGVLNMALTPVLNLNGERFLFFRPLSSKSLFAADADEVSNAARDHVDVQYYGRSHIFSNQVSSMTFSSSGVLLYGAIEDIGIGCWRMDRPVTPENFVTPVIDRKRLQYVAGLKVKTNSETGQEELLILSNRLQKVYRDTLNFEETNFYVLRIPVDSVIKNTVCEPDTNFAKTTV